MRPESTSQDPPSDERHAASPEAGRLRPTPNRLHRGVCGPVRLGVVGAYDGGTAGDGQGSEAGSRSAPTSRSSPPRSTSRGSRSSGSPRAAGPGRSGQPGPAAGHPTKPREGGRGEGPGRETERQPLVARPAGTTPCPLSRQPVSAHVSHQPSRRWGRRSPNVSRPTGEPRRSTLVSRVQSSLTKSRQVGGSPSVLR